MSVEAQRAPQLKPSPRGRFPVGLTLAVLICEMILVALGSWQVQRMAWKQSILTQVAALRSAPPRPLAPVLERAAQGASVAYTRVTLDCPGLAQAPYLEVYSVREGVAGTRLVSACRLADGPYRSILVDRGFVADYISARPSIDPASLVPMTITGVLRAPDPPGLFAPVNDPAGRLWYWRDTAAMAVALHAAGPAPVFVAAENSTNPGWRALSPDPIPEDIPNNHFAYALTWFGLAVALAGVYLAMLFRRRGPP